ncbi:hypothetical protein BSKO_07999 [Bryopsis sp. KO-2023]|nr:hypothetical protein BSKO_07999 [Bryopsis sp. KO-2023]
MAKLFASLVILAVAVAAVDATRYKFGSSSRTFFKTKPFTSKNTFTVKFVKASDVETTKTVVTTKTKPDVPEVVVDPAPEVESVETKEPTTEVESVEIPAPAPEAPVVVEAVPEPEVPVVIPEPAPEPEIPVEIPEPVAEPEVPVVVEPVPEPVPEVPEIAVVPNEAQCEVGSFFVDKVEFKGCMECDAQCTGDCVDLLGCRECAPGYFTFREDTAWPYECKKCEDFVPGCTTCKNDIDLEAGGVPECAV